MSLEIYDYIIALLTNALRFYALKHFVCIFAPKETCKWKWGAAVRFGLGIDKPGKLLLFFSGHEYPVKCDKPFYHFFAVSN